MSQEQVITISRRLLYLVLGATVISCSRTSNESYGERVAADLAELREATAPFQLLDSAVVAAYPRVVQDCLVHEHHGAMGFHHVNRALVDNRLDLDHPEILLYERVSESDYRLNAVEFIVPFRSWPADSTAPQIMDQKLRREDNLKIWYLHVWAWKDNPDGLFANFHPDVQCPPETSKVFRPSSG